MRFRETEAEQKCVKSRNCLHVVNVCFYTFSRWLGAEQKTLSGVPIVLTLHLVATCPQLVRQKTKGDCNPKLFFFFFTFASLGMK